jgi:putative ABC transport system permease protein
MVRNPLWRKASLTLRRYPGLLAALVGGAALLAAAAAASPLFVSASGSAALRTEIDHATAYGAGLYVAAPNTPNAPPQFHESNFDDRVNVLTDELESIPEVGPLISTQLLPAVTASVAGKTGPTITVRPMSRTGGVEHITQTSGGGDGLWLSNEAAKVMGAKAGDTLLLDSGAGRKARVRVAGIYTALYEEQPTPYWRSLHNEIYPGPPAYLTPPTFLIGDEGTMKELADKLAVDQVIGHWEAPLRPDAPTLAQAASISKRLDALGQRIESPNGDLRPTFFCTLCFRQTLEYTTGLSRAVKSAQTTTATVQGPIDLLADAGALVALAVLGAVAAFGLARRRVEMEFLFARGLGPGALGARAVLESLLPVLAGGVLGFGLAYATIVLAGPQGGVDHGALRDAAGTVAIAVAVGLLLVGIVSGALYAARTRPTTGTHRRRSIPWELPVLVAAGWCLYRLLDTGALSAGSAGVARPSVYLLLFPILGIAGVAGLASRALVRAVGLWRARTVRRSSEATYLAAHRLAAAPRLLVLLVTASALALGIFIYSETVVSSYRSTVRSASLLSTGADVKGLTSFDRETPKLPIPATKVTKLYGSGTVTLDGVSADLMAVEPETFAQTAYWNGKFSSSSLDSILAELAKGGSPLPVAVVGASRDAKTLRTPAGSMPVRVAATARAFPGMSRDHALVIVALGPFDRAVKESGQHNPLDVPGAFTEIWARGETARAERLLTASSARPYPLSTALEAQQQPEVTAFTRTFTFLEALGLAAALLGVAGVVVYLQVRQRGNAVAFGLARRMGLRARSHRRAVRLELGLALAVAFVLGLVLALVAARLVLTEVEPVRSISPVPLFDTPVLVALLGGAAVALVALVGGALAHRAAARANLAEVLRLGE